MPQLVIQLGSNAVRSIHRSPFSNRAVMLLWSSQAVSTIGDSFFNLAVMWVVYTQSHSALQTALIQVIWHMDRILFGPLAGIVADRWDRKRIMVLTNLLSAIVVGALVVVIPARGHVSPVIIFAAVFVLNSLNTFLAPARFSLMPEVVGRDLLATASGLFTIVEQAAAFLGNALAGVVIATVGATWAVAADALSFLCAALPIAIAPLPVRTNSSSSPEQHPSFLREIRDGWRTIANQPVVRVLLWLSVLINVPSFTGPLYPALVRIRLHNGAAAYGTVMAVGIIGAVAGGALAGPLERRLGAGRLIGVAWGLAGVSFLGIAASTWLALTAALECTLACGLTVGTVSLGALMQALIPENYRGRVGGIARAITVVAIPLSALMGGWLADILGLLPLFVAAGVWVLGVAGLASLNRTVRGARI